VIEGMNGVNSLVSSWGGEHTKHCDHTQSPTPRPADREAVSLLPWTEARENVRDILPHLQKTSLASLPPEKSAKLEGKKTAPPRRKVALLELALSDSDSTEMDTITLKASEFATIIAAMRKAEKTVPLFRVTGFLERSPTVFMLDCGANENYFGPSIRESAKIRLTPLEAPYTVTTATGEEVAINSKARPRVQIGQFVRRMPFKLAPIEPGTCILGMSFLDSVDPLIRWKERRIRLPVNRLEGANYEWIQAIQDIPKAIALLKETTPEESIDEEDDTTEAASTLESNAISAEETITLSDLCDEEVGIGRPDPMWQHCQGRLNTLLKEQTEATWHDKCRWWDYRPRWDSGEKQANKLLTQVVLEARGEGPILGIPPEKKKEFDINDVPELLRPLLREFADVFPAELPTGLPPSRRVGTQKDMHIDVQNGTQPQWRAAYKCSPADAKIIEEQVQELLRQGRIRPSTSPWAAGTILVDKKDADGNKTGERMCGDFRPLNARTVPDRSPLPKTEELMMRLKGAKWFFKLDLQSGYHQIRLDDASIPLTAFSTPSGHYEWLVVPFGVRNAPPVFQRMMQDVLGNLIDNGVVCYLDDILGYAETLEDLAVLMRKVFTLLRQHKLYAKLSKCVFGATEVQFLGYKVNDQGIRTDESKITAVQNWPVPDTVSDVRSFLGLTGFYQKFVKGYAGIAGPLTDLLKGRDGEKMAKVEWGTKEQTAFDDLKEALTTAPVLATPDPDKKYHIYTDACGYGIGATLAQVHEEGLRPVAYRSRKMTPAEANNLWTHEQELLAIVDAVKCWTPYIGGLDIVWHTDHEALIWLASQPKLSKKQASWLRTLCEYPIELKYLPGKQNPAADALSRLNLLRRLCLLRTPEGGSSHVTTGAICHSLATLRTEITTEDWETAYLEDPVTAPEWVAPTQWRKVKHLLWSASQVVVPRLLQEKVVSRYHTAGHLGEKKTEQQIRRRFWWRGIQQQVKRAVRHCVVCQRCKPKRKRKAGLLQPLAVPRQRWQSIGMDFLCGIPVVKNCNMIMVVVDRLTKMAHFVPCATTLTAEGCATLLKEHVFRHHGLPAELVSDRDPRFTSNFWKGLLETLDIGSLKSTANHPQTDGQTERVNGSLINILRCYLEERKAKGETWLSGLVEAEMVYNGSPHAATGVSPYFLNYGYEPVLPHEDPEWVLDKEIYPNAKKFVDDMKRAMKTAKEAMAKQQEVMIRTANRLRHDGPKWKSGDSVLLEAEGITHVPQGKLAPYFVGPLTVLEVLPGGSTYRLSLPPSWSRMHNAFHESVLRPFCGEPDEQVAPLPLTDTIVLGGQSPCIGLQEEPGTCTQSHRKIGKCGYCVTCHRQAMSTYGLPMRCTSYADHRVQLLDGFVAPAAPAAAALPAAHEPAAPAEEQLAAPAALPSEQEDVVDIPEDVVASQPPPHAPPTEEEELDFRRAMVARDNRLREARREARARARED